MALFLFSVPSVSSQGLFEEEVNANGYMITLLGDSIPVRLTAKTHLISGELILLDVVDGLKYYDPKLDKKKKITVMNTKEFGYIINSKVYRYKSVAMFIPDHPFADRMFLKLEISDYLKLYSETHSGSTGSVNAMTGSYTSTGSSTETYYYLQKGDENPFIWHYLAFRMEICEYLREDKELVEKINKRELKEKDIAVIVNEYNRWYKYERNAR